MSKKRMKQIVYLLLFSFIFSNVFVSFGGTASAVNVGDNLLQNPGFEQEALAGWTTSTTPAGISVVASRIGGTINYNFKSGAYSLRHFSTSANETYTYQTVSGLPDGIYIANAWVRRPSTTVSYEIAQMEVTVGSGAIGSGNTPTYTVQTTTGAAFQLVTIENIVVSNGAGQATLCFHSKAPAAATGTPVLYVDDAEFKLVQKTTTTYTVTYNSNGGTTIDAAQVESGSTAQQPVDPTKSGYHFDGWYSDEAFTSLYNFTNPISSNITLYAKWSSINLLSNPGFEQDALASWSTAGSQAAATKIGGTAGTNYKSGTSALRHLSSEAYEAYTYQTVTGLPDGIYSASAWVRRPNTATLQEIAQMEVTVGNGAVGIGNTPTYAAQIDTGSAFQQLTIENIVVNNGAGQASICFHTKAPKTTSGTPVLYVDDVEFKLVGGITTLYTVSFDSNGGSAVQPKQVASGSNFQKPTDPVKTGYTFAGWYTENTLSNPYNFTTNIVTSDITLYAKWTEIPVDLDNFIKNPGFEEATLTYWQPTIKGSGSVEKANGVQGTNYRSGSYSMKHQSSGVYEATSAQSVTNLEQGLYTVTAYIRMPAAASFDTAKMSVTTGATSTEPQYTANITSSAIFVPYTIQDVLVTDGNLKLSFYTKTGASGKVMYIDDVEVKLTQAVTDYYTVSFNTNGGSTVADRYTVAGKTVNPPSTPKNIGHIFNGWYTEDILTNLYNFSTPVNSNITLYAKWTEIPIDPDNLIQNPGFEKATPENWKITTNLPATATISDGVEKVDYNSGTAALKLTQSKRYQAWVTQTVEGLEKGYYTAKAWVRRPVAVRVDDVYRMQALDYGDAAKTTNIPGSNDYVQITIDNILVLTGKCTIEFYVQTFDNHILYIDDVELKKTNTPFTTLVANFDSQGGSDVNSVMADGDRKIQQPADPKKTGYTFEGWYTDSACTQAFNLSKPITSDVNLYAKWEDSAVPMIGNIRWDVLNGYAPFDELNSLSLQKYNYRAPFFTSIDENYKVTGNDNSVEMIEREINYAVAGGIDYWAFTTGPELGKNNPEYYALDKFLATEKRKEIGFSIIIHRYDDTPWENRVDMLVKWMQEPNFVKVMGNRPLVYIYRVGELEAKYGAGQEAQNAINLIRTKAQAAGLGNPYIVAMASSTPESLAQNKSYIENYGLDAISAYGYAGERNDSNLESYAPYSQLATENIASWDNYKATGKKMIPLVALGRNEETRKDTKVVYGGGYGPFFDNPTATEAAIQVKAGLEYVRNNDEVCESNAILSYAWNEFAEGGWICPTLSEGTAKLDAIAAMKREYTAWIEENSKKPASGNSTAAAALIKVLEKKTDSTGQITLNANAVAQLERLIINGGASLELDKSMLKNLNIKESITATIKVSTTPVTENMKEIIGNRPVFDLSLLVDGKSVTSFGNAKVKVSIPYEKTADEHPNAILVYYINSEGAARPVTAKYNAQTKAMEFETNHFSTFGIGYNEVKFSDVSGQWFADAVTFLAARGISKGVSADKFGPEELVTRGQFVTMLCQAYDIEAKSGDNFSDCGDTYYTGYLAAAKQLKISGGVGNNRFAPEKEITREEMLVLLYSILATIGNLDEPTENASVDFADIKELSPWAIEAAEYFTQNGIISGSGNKLSPKSKATRAELAQTLYNLLK